MVKQFKSLILFCIDFINHYLTPELVKAKKKLKNININIIIYTSKNNSVGKKTHLLKERIIDKSEAIIFFQRLTVTL